MTRVHNCPNDRLHRSLFALIYVPPAAALVLSVFLFSSCASSSGWNIFGKKASNLQIATFSADVTPPMGHPLCGGWIEPVKGIDDPELAKGIILRDAGGTYVLCAVDWCELRDETYDMFRSKIAAAAGTPVSRVAVQTVHQHNAPIADGGAQRLLDKEKDSPPHADLKFLEAAADRVAASVREAENHWQRVTHVGTGKAKVDRVASNRRVPGPKGEILVRYSATKEKALQDAPEGLIDPWLRTIAFYDGDKTVACLHYYATHPMSYYGDGRPTWDFAGIARQQMEKETGAFQIYFTGCAGNITAGKYNDGSHELRPVLAERMHNAMQRSLASCARSAVAPIKWKTLNIDFPLRTEPDFTEPTYRKTMADPKQPAQPRLIAALGVSWIERVKSNHPIELSCLSMGAIRIVHLPGEPFIEFQLGAQERRPDCFVAVAGYGEAATGYICLEKSYGEGGYEPTASQIAPPSEKILKEAISDLLTD